MPEKLIPVLGTSFVLDLEKAKAFPLASVTIAELGGAAVEEWLVGAKGRKKSVAVERPKTSDITIGRAFRAGTPDAMVLYDWHKTVYENGYTKALQDGAIIGFDTTRKEISRFNFYEAWPKSYKWPALDAKGGSFLKEEIVIVCNRWERIK